MLRILQIDIYDIKQFEIRWNNYNQGGTSRDKQWKLLDMLWSIFSSGCLQKEVQRDRSHLGKPNQNNVILVHCGFSLF